MSNHSPIPAPYARGGQADLVRVLLIVQAGFGLVAMLGEVALMASPLYLLAPLAKTVLLLVVARRVVAGRRWALVTAITVQVTAVTGFWIATLAGLLPQIDHTITVTALATEIAIPITIIVCCAQLLSATPRRRRVRLDPTLPMHLPAEVAA